MKHNRILLLFSIIFISLYSLRLDSIPLIAMDEGWFSFYSIDLFNMNPFPQLHSEIQYKLFCLYPALCALWFKLTSVSLSSLRYLAVISGWLGLVGLYKLIRHITPSAKIIALGLFLYTTSNITLVTSRWGRPEGFIFTTLIWCLYGLYIGISDNKKEGYLWAGFLCSVMVLLHPFSLVSVLPITGCCLLLNIKKQKKNIAYFFIGACPLFIAFLFNMFVINIEYTKLHLFGDMTERFAMSGSTSLSKRVFYFFHSYTLGIKRLYILIFELGMLIYSTYFFRKNTALKSLSWVGIVTFLLGILCISPFRRRYFGVVMMISLITTCATLAHTKTLKFKKWLFVAIGLYMINNLSGDLVYVYKHHKNTPYSTIGSAIRASIPENARIATLIQFWIPLSDSFTITDIHDFPINGYQTMTNLLNDNAIDYVVYSDYLLNNISPTTGESAIGYDPTKNSYSHAIETIIVPHWSVVSIIPTTGYGDITIYKAPITK